MGDLPRLVSHKDIIRGKIFNVAVPHTSGRPLNFVIEDPGQKGTYKIITKDDGFEGEKDPKTGKKIAPVVKVVTEFKLRPAIVISDDYWNNNEDYYSVVVVPIASIYEEDKKNPLIKRMMTSNDLDGLHYIGTKTGRDAYVTVNDPVRLNKNMLFEPKKQIVLDDPLMTVLMEKFAKCFAVKKIARCRECEHNCESCEFRLAVNK
ncbi:MAG: hypothetical protein K0R93_243 [Anaerosolibacter sp.]|jgi:hypothetical protein|uniref:type II toxin-antitoxin system PemK/MazF family toxin n=1 Tax=Anaerosolibacter sp. TaxID=1872527 RepID=UPI0026048D07|nr:type II toxin-antitoxin system PemK/MazF family toxin [Anaerosolibacter sp.]MDF2545345.1 hypothetical protein [Anaerosolibacter sp.]